jgi:hypothetical protein
MMTGTVRDLNTGLPLWLAHVVAFETDETFIGGAVTNADGRFLLHIPGPVREVLIRVSSIGYADYSEVVDSESEWLNIDLDFTPYELPVLTIYNDPPPTNTDADTANNGGNSGNGGGASGALLLLLLLVAASQS